MTCFWVHSKYVCFSEEPSSDSGIDESMMEVQEESIVSHSEVTEM